jgi:xylulokinase
MMADGAGEDAAAPPRVARVVEPERALRDAFAEGHARYRAAYRATREF